MYVLGIETSCDETSAAIVSGDRKILSNLVLSQIKEHKAFGGVVPEVAARAHLEHLHTLIDAAIKDARLTFDDLNGVAATCGPGLIGGVMVGMMAGKAIAAARNIPFIGVNHLEGHALTPRLTDDIPFPYLLLLVSGGHTQILIAENVGVYKRWGTTLDDAAGECFDKCAKLMGLGYPGGPQVQKLAAQCKDPAKAKTRFPLPVPMKGRKDYDFSFSGLKTAVRTHIEKLPPGELQIEEVAMLSHALQSAIADSLADRCENAMKTFVQRYAPNRKILVVSGGVAANSQIRKTLESISKRDGFELNAPPLSLCSDNAAMIAWAGIEHLNKGRSDNLYFKARPRWPLDPSAEPRQGAGVKA